MSTLKINTLSNLAGSQSTPVENAINGSAKAWVNFNGTGTVAIRAAYNVSSITDNGTGDYRVNFTTALMDTNYALVATGDAGGVGDFAVCCTGDHNLPRTTSFVCIRIGNTAGGVADSAIVCVSALR
jgi:hypothetical protein